MINDYQDLLKIAEAEGIAKGADVGVAVKEILHYDILYALSESSVSKRLVFQGGTSLRLCHHGNRYSEDLDFVAGYDGLREEMEHFKDILIRTINDRYRLEVSFKDPKPVRFEHSDVEVTRWVAQVHIPRANKALKQSEKIKIEIADVPSYDNEPMLIEPHYAGLAPGFGHIMMRAQTLEEILADKILAVAGRKTLKSRDVWDIDWMNRLRNVTVNMDLVHTKLRDYNEIDGFEDRIEGRIEEMKTEKYAKVYQQEMLRFLDNEVSGPMRQNPRYAPAMLKNAAEYLEGVMLEYRKTKPKPKANKPVIDLGKGLDM